jgi:hypothetical protein
MFSPSGELALATQKAVARGQVRAVELQSANTFLRQQTRRGQRLPLDVGGYVTERT